MPVSVVYVREMGVGVRQYGVLVMMDVWLPDRIVGPVRVLMVGIVDVPVPMREPLMDVVVPVAFREVQPDADTHRGTGDQQPQCDRLVPEDGRQDRSHERRRGEVGPGARGARSRRASTNSSRLNP